MKIYSKTFNEIETNSNFVLNKDTYTVNAINFVEDSNLYEVTLVDSKFKEHVLTIKNDDVIAVLKDKENPYANLGAEEVYLEVDGNVINSFEEAVTAAREGKTIKLLKNIATNGIKVPDESRLTIDLNGFTLDVKGNVGSTNTEVNGLQLLKKSSVTIKNGKITTPDAKILIQNYSNLTLDNVQVYGAATTEYVLSNNFGNIVLKNNTVLSAQKNNVAFDMYYGMNKNGWYDTGVYVTIADSSVKIRGRYEYGKASRKTEAEFIANTALLIPVGYSLKAIDGYEWVYNKENKVKLTKKN